MALRDLKDASGHRPYKCEEARLRSSTLNPIEEGASAMAHSMSNRIQLRPPFAANADPLQVARVTPLTEPRPASRSLR